MDLKYNFLITYIGDKRFETEFLDTNEKNEAGSGLCGIIRYTYFEDYSLPEIGWKTFIEDLLNDYTTKATNDILEQKIKLNYMNY